jgi:hypothetical protein
VRTPRRLLVAIALLLSACTSETDRGVEALARARLVRDLSLAAVTAQSCRIERGASGPGARCEEAAAAAREATRSGDGYEQACRRCASAQRCAAERRGLEERWREEDPVLGGRPGSACTP